MELSCHPVAAEARPEGSPYAEFWLSAPGIATGFEKAAARLIDAVSSGTRSPRRRRTCAHHLLDGSRDLLKGADFIQYAVTASRQPYDPASEGDDGFGYLSDAALPDDPSSAAIIAIIDDSIPFAHELLTVEGRDGRRHSRVASVWMQGACPLTPAATAPWQSEAVPRPLAEALGFDRNPPPVGADLRLGRELRGRQIDTLLGHLGTPTIPDEGTLYRVAGAIDLARPSPPGWARAASHGAAVATLAAGFMPTDADARRFPVIAVCLPPEITRDTMGGLGPYFIALAYLHILHRARRLCRFIEARRGLRPGSLKLPVVINLSYGVTAGPKDGQSQLERFQDELCTRGWFGLPTVRCVLPAGNHRMAQLHARLQARPGKKRITETLRWVLHPDDATPNAVEVWGPPQPPDAPPGKRLKIAIRPPGAEDFVKAPFPKGDGWVTLIADGVEIARLRRVRDTTPERTREFVAMILHPTRPRGPGDPMALPGEWALRVSGPAPGPIDVTLQRDESLTGFRSGARQSVMEDVAYRSRQDSGLPLIDDPLPPESPLRRRGTLNAYATGRVIARVAGAVCETPAASYEGARLRSAAATAAPVPFDDVTMGDASDAVYSGMDTDGFGGSRVADLPGMDLGIDARWKAACDRSTVRPGLIVPGILSGSRQILQGTSLAAPRVTRYLAWTMAEENRART